MKTPLSRVIVAVVAVGLFASPAAAQTTQTDDSASKTLRLLKAPETPAELWDAVKFSVNVGKPADAAGYLDRLLESNPSADLLITIRERDGSKMFPKLAASPELTAKGRVLLERVEKAAADHATNPERIQKFIEYLTRSPEHRSYAIAQLRSAGADAVPYLFAALRDPTMAEHHATLLVAMQRLTPSALPPLVAALASDDNSVLSDAISVLSVLGDRDTVPHLRFLAEASDVPEPIQIAARQAVSRILGVKYADLPSAKEAIVEQARRHDEHRVELHASSSGIVRLWRWVPREGLKDQEVPTSYAEEYFGLGHCRQALALDPNYEPAQLVMLSLAFEKVYERVGVDQALPEGSGLVSAAALTVGPELLVKVLARALDEGRPAVAIAALRTLARTGNSQMLAAQPGRPSPVVVALSSPDRRIQFAAAETVLSLKPQQPFPGSSQVVPILARNLVAASAARAVVIDPDNARGSALASLLQEAGYEGQAVPNARDGFTMVAESADYELIFIDPAIHDPNISPAIAQLRADPRTAGIPVIVVGDRASDDQLSKFERRYPRVKYFLRPATIGTLKLQLDPLIASLQSMPLAAAERADNARRSAAWLAQITRGEIRGLDARPAEQALVASAANDALGPDVLIALGSLPSPKAQGALALVLLDDSGPMPMRLEAAKQITHSLRQFGVMLPASQTANVVELMERTGEPVFHQVLASVVGSMRPRSSDAGVRLRELRTPPFDPAAAPVAPKPAPAEYQ